MSVLVCKYACDCVEGVHMLSFSAAALALSDGTYSFSVYVYYIQDSGLYTEIMCCNHSMMCQASSL